MSSFSLSNPSLTSQSLSPALRHHLSLLETEKSSTFARNFADNRGAFIPAVDNRPGTAIPSLGFRLLSNFQPPSTPQFSLRFVPALKVPKQSSENSVSSEVIRRGFVSVKEDTFSSIFWTRKWVVLMEKTSRKTKDSNVIDLCDITNIERTDRKPHCLLINTKHMNIFLSFKNDRELYAWQDDVYSRSLLGGICFPTDFVHNIHVRFDPFRGAFTGFFQPWVDQQAQSAMTMGNSPRWLTDASELYPSPSQGGWVNNQRPVFISSKDNELYGYRYHAYPQSSSMRSDLTSHNSRYSSGAFTGLPEL